MAPPTRRHRHLRRLLFAAVALVGLFLISVTLIKLNVFHPPYPAFGKSYCWLIGCQEEAYNFGEVVPGRIYRSAQPDERFLRHLRDERGLRRVISLNGESDLEASAKRLGLELKVYDWVGYEFPPPGELGEVLELMSEDEPVLVHCRSGANRSGFAVAAYRVYHQGWSIEKAKAEARKYWIAEDGQVAMDAGLPNALASPDSRPASR